jgi:hypothetical protein
MVCPLPYGRGSVKLIFALIGFASALSAQTLAQWDGSGNAQLTGIYNFRQVIWSVANQRGDLQGALALYGTLNFSGTGSYTLTCQFLDSSAGRAQNCPALTGTYLVGKADYHLIDDQAIHEGMTFFLEHLPISPRTG